MGSRGWGLVCFAHHCTVPGREPLHFLSFLKEHSCLVIVEAQLDLFYVTTIIMQATTHFVPGTASLLIYNLWSQHRPEEAAFLTPFDLSLQFRKTRLLVSQGLNQECLPLPQLCLSPAVPVPHTLQGCPGSRAQHAVLPWNGTPILVWESCLATFAHPECIGAVPVI